MTRAILRKTIVCKLYWHCLNVWTRPALKSAPAFGGIARIMAGDQGDAEDGACEQSGGYNSSLSLIEEIDMPSFSAKSKEHHEHEDMYRRNLAAFWTAQAGELKADECIEDIFAGGDGWAKHDDPNHPANARNVSISPGAGRGMHNRNASSRGSIPAAGQPHHHSRVYSGPSGSGVSGRASLEQHANNMKAEAEANQTNSNLEIDEFDVREDLKSWKLPEQVV